MSLGVSACAGAWPGVLLFLGFAWAELVFQGAAVPANLAVMALVILRHYLDRDVLFGKDTWLRYGEAFSLAFSLLARFAPTEVRVRPTPLSDLWSGMPGSRWRLHRLLCVFRQSGCSPARVEPAPLRRRSGT